MRHLVAKVAAITLCLAANLTGNSQKPWTDQMEMKKTEVGKLYFSNQPFTTSNAGSKTNFTSSEFIYARLETDGGRKLEDVLKVPAAQKKGVYPRFYLYCIVLVYKDGKQQGFNDACVWVLNDVNLGGTSLNFDIIPGPHSVSTELTTNEPQYYDRDWNVSPSVCGPLARLIKPNIFTEPGNYTIKVEVCDMTSDEWGKLEPVAKWPSFRGEFDFAFSTSDVPKITSDRQAVWAIFKADMDKQKKAAATKIANQARDAHMINETPPDGWKLKSNALGAGVTTDQVKDLFSRNTPGVGILKIYATAYNGWKVDKNRLGIPTFKYVDQEIRVFYKINNEACGCKTMHLRQPYMGGGKYGKSELALSSGPPFLCSKLN